MERAGGLLEAAAKLGRGDVRYLLVGSAQGRKGYLKRLESMACRLALLDVVRIIDHCGDMPAATCSPTWLSRPRPAEAFGRVVAEANLGRPVVVSDHGGPREQVVEGETGWLRNRVSRRSRRGDGESARLDVRGAPGVGRQGDPKRSGKFSKDVMCAKTLDVYNEVLDIESISGRGRILVIKLSALGDFVQAIGSFQAIRAHHRPARLVLLTTGAYESSRRPWGYSMKFGSTTGRKPGGWAKCASLASA